MLGYLFRCLLGIAMLSFIGLMGFAGSVSVIPFYIVVRPFSEGSYLKIVCWMQSTFLCMFPLFIEHVCGIELRVTGTMPPKEAALVLPNHLNHDWAPMYCMGYRSGALGYVRTVIKDVIQYVPGLGWAMFLTYWPFVSRSYEKDQVKLRRLFGAYAKAGGLPVQTWLYAEGTRLTKKKLAASQQYAKDKGYPEKHQFEHVMLPKHRGFNLAVTSMKGSVNYVHEITLQYTGWGKGAPRAPSLWEMMITDRSKPHVMHVHMTRTPMATLPGDDDGRKDWLLDSFARKDALLKEFAKTGAFPGKVVSEKTNWMPMVLQLLPWCAFLYYSFVALTWLF